jgi:hypothetical protein
LRRPDTILPEAELIVVRQVLQHLDNKSIATILEKCKKYKYALITESIYINASEYNIDNRLAAVFVLIQELFLKWRLLIYPIPLHYW